MIEITGTTHQPSSIAQHRVDHFQELALAIDANAALPNDNLLRTDWVLHNNIEASQARAFGEHWWTHMMTGYSYFLNPSFLPALEPSVNASLSFENCISGLQDVLEHLQTLSGDDHHHATDGMSLARARARLMREDGAH